MGLGGGDRFGGLNASQDVLAIKKTGKSNITFHLVHPTKRQLDDLEMDFDFSDVKVRDEVYKASMPDRSGEGLRMA